MGEPFVVQLANRPGELGHLAHALGMRGINILKMAGSAAGDQACALLTTDDDKATDEVLHSMGVDYVSGSTLIVEVKDGPDTIDKLTQKLTSGGVRVRGYCVIGLRCGNAEIALSVDDECKARQTLGLPQVHVVEL
jgi:hypothetical protein